jgi:hypothetical protein
VADGRGIELERGGSRDVLKEREEMLEEEGM